MPCLSTGRTTWTQTVGGALRAHDWHLGRGSPGRHGTRCSPGGCPTRFLVPPPPADLALLALFGGAANTAGGDASSSGGTATQASNTVVMGQALTAPAHTQPALVVPTAAPAAPAPAAHPGALAPNPVAQLQFQAVMQHQAAIMQNPQAYPAAAQMYQQAILVQQQQQAAVAQQQMLAAQQQAAAAAVAVGAVPTMPVPTAAAPPATMLLGKRGKSQEEVEEQTERIKKRRRESAQRRWGPCSCCARCKVPPCLFQRAMQGVECTAQACPVCVCICSRSSMLWASATAVCWSCAAC